MLWWCLTYKSIIILFVKHYHFNNIEYTNTQIYDFIKDCAINQHFYLIPQRHCNAQNNAKEPFRHQNIW